MAIPNSKMTAGRYQKWAEYRKLHNAIVSHLSNGGVVQITTMLKSWIYTPKHASWFTVSPNGVFVQQGKAKNCINYTSIQFGRYASH